MRVQKPGLYWEIIALSHSLSVSLSLAGPCGHACSLFGALASGRARLMDRVRRGPLSLSLPQANILLGLANPLAMPASRVRCDSYARLGVCLKMFVRRGRVSLEHRRLSRVSV